MPVRGDRANARFRFAAMKRGGGWSLVFTNLEVNDEVIDIATCRGNDELGHHEPESVEDVGNRSCVWDG